MKKAMIYIHGRGGNADEAEHYKSLFMDADVIGFDYCAQTPWEAKEEFSAYFAKVFTAYDEVRLIANSIGAFFAMHALADANLKKAYFISPIVDMESLLSDMMRAAGVDEETLRQKGRVRTLSDEVLDYAYLSYVRTHPLSWRTPTAILYGERDRLQSLAAVSSFAKQIGASLTVMAGGEHWFYTAEQMRFLDKWILHNET